MATANLDEVTRLWQNVAPVCDQRGADLCRGHGFNGKCRFIRTLLEPNPDFAPVKKEFYVRVLSGSCEQNNAGTARP